MPRVLWPMFTAALVGLAIGALALYKNHAKPLPPPPIERLSLQLDPHHNPAIPHSHAHVPLATIARGACYGTCPVYHLTVYRDGAVEYDGERFVKVKGRATATISQDQVDALEDLFVQNRFLSLEDTYIQEGMTDMPDAKTSYTPTGEPTKQVWHYFGDSSAPKRLEAVEDGIDRTADSARWIGTRDERRQIRD